MPIITAEGPPIRDLDKKRDFARRLTQAAAEVYDLPAETIIILFKDNTPDNVSVGGVLLVDRK